MALLRMAADPQIANIKPCENIEAQYSMFTRVCVHITVYAHARTYTVSDTVAKQTTKGKRINGLCCSLVTQLYLTAIYPTFLLENHNSQPFAIQLLNNNNSENNQ